MKSLHRYLLVAGLVGSLGLAAVAQSQTTSVTPTVLSSATAPDGIKGEERRDRMQRKIERKLGQLKQKLQVTPAQEAAWTAWTGAIRPGAKTQHPSRQDMAALTTPERIDRMLAMRAQRNAAMDQRFEATKTFYAALTAEQKKVFDAESLRLTQRYHGKRGHGHRG